VHAGARRGSDDCGTLARFPILDGKLGDAGEFRNVVGDEDGAMSQSDGCDQEIVGADEVAAARQVAAQAAIDLRRLIVKRQTFEIRRKLPNQRQALGWLGATACAEVKFRLDDGAQQDVLAPESGEACSDTRLTPAQKFDADVCVEQVAHSG